MRDIDNSRRGDGPGRRHQPEGRGRRNLIVTQNEQTGEIRSAADGKFAIYTAATDYLVPAELRDRRRRALQQAEVDFGGGCPWVHVSLHKPQYAVVDICPVDQAGADGARSATKPPTPKCDDEQAVTQLVLERDLGSLRVPPFVAFLAFVDPVRPDAARPALA